MNRKGGVGLTLFEIMKTTRAAGKREGIKKGKIELYHTEFAYSTEQIAEKMGIPEKEVKTVLKELSLI